jgi:hypothetical protein
VRVSDIALAVSTALRTTAVLGALVVVFRWFTTLRATAAGLGFLDLAVPVAAVSLAARATVARDCVAVAAVARDDVPPTAVLTAAEARSEVFCVAGCVRGCVTTCAVAAVLVKTLLSRTAASETPMQTNTDKAKNKIFFILE